MEGATTSKLAQLPFTEKYSDLKLICQEKVFKVHKVVVCTQSPVISTACEKDSQEVTTNIVRVTMFDPTTVQRMVDYLYAKDYTVDLGDDRAKLQPGSEEEKSSHNHSNINVPPSGTVTVSCLSNDSGEEHTRIAAGNAILIYHIRVNAIAEYYEIPPLRRLANKNINDILHAQWTKNGFSKVVKEALTISPDKALHNTISSCVAQNIEYLMTRKHFRNFEFMDPFAASIMQHLVKQYSESRAKVSVELRKVQEELNAVKLQMSRLRGDFKAEIHGHRELKNNVDRSKDIFSHHLSCRNICCNVEFNSYVEEEAPGLFLLRCSKCRCKHQG